MDRRDFFISHADSDLAWAEWIAQQLVEAGYTVELDVWDWVAGTNLVDAMRRALERAERVLAVYTDDYFAQRISQAEHTAAFASDRVVPVVVADCSIPELYAPLTRIELLGLEEDAARSRLLDGVSAGSRRPGSPVIFPGRVEFPRRLPRIWNVPARNPFFTGRDDLLRALDGRLRQSDAQAIAVVPLRGMGGVGKSQLAVEYAHRRAAGYEIVWWVNAENPTLATSGLVELSAALGLPAGSPAEVLRSLWSALARRTDWLLIYDNADSPPALAELRPPDSGRLLLTSRNPAFGRFADLVEVGDFDRSESVALLRHRCPALSPGQADQIAAAVGDLPLAVEQAGCFLQETGLDVADYLGLLAASPAHAGLDDPTVDRHPGLVAVVTASRARLRAASPRAAVVFDQLAFCAAELLPLTPRRPAGNSGPFGVEIGDSAATADVVRQFTSLGLARNRGTALQVHRLVQALVRSFLSDNEQAQRCQQAQELLATVRPGNHDDPTVWSSYAVLTPHVQSLVAHSCSLGVPESQDFRVLLLDVVRYLEQSGRSRDALEMSLAAYQRWSKTLGGDHPDTLTAAHRYGNALVRLGDYGAARKVFESTHAGRGRALGADHMLTLGTAANLAVVAALAGDEQAARRITEDVLNRRRRVLGPDHPDTLESASNLGAHLDNLGEWKAAWELGQDTLARRQRVLGE
ncbi:GTP-binding protein, partial [Parafrankia colletiae]